MASISPTTTRQSGVSVVRSLHPGTEGSLQISAEARDKFGSFIGPFTRAWSASYCCVYSKQAIAACVSSLALRAVILRPGNIPRHPRVGSLTLDSKLRILPRRFPGTVLPVRSGFPDRSDASRSAVRPPADRHCDHAMAVLVVGRLSCEGFHNQHNQQYPPRGINHGSEVKGSVLDRTQSATQSPSPDQCLCSPARCDA